MALHHAKLSKINTERGISRISSFDYERENIRRIWWLLFRDFSFLSNLLGFSSILNSENQIFLPKSNYYFESPTSEDYFGIEVMSSDEWYTAIATGLDIDSYHAILHQIQLKAFRHFDMELSGEDYTASYYAGAIHASLNDWIDQFHPFLQSAMTAIRNSAHVENTWFSLYIALIYYSIRVKLILPNLMRNVIRGKDVRNILYFSDAYDAAITGSILVNMVQRYNPNLDFFATAALLTIFPTGFFLLCCSKLGITECESSYKDTMEGIKYFSRAFQKMNQFYSVLQLLESKDLIETVIYYGIFVTRQSSEFFERPSTRNY